MKNTYVGLSVTPGYIEWLKSHPSGLNTSALIKALIIKEIMHPTSIKEFNKLKYLLTVIKPSSKEELEKMVQIEMSDIDEYYAPAPKIEKVTPAREIEERAEKSIENREVAEENTTINVEKNLDGNNKKRKRREVVENDFNSMI